jgi:hypothetical protein
MSNTGTFVCMYPRLIDSCWANYIPVLMGRLTQARGERSMFNVRCEVLGAITHISTSMGPRALAPKSPLAICGEEDVLVLRRSSLRVHASADC